MTSRQPRRRFVWQTLASLAPLLIRRRALAATTERQPGETVGPCRRFVTGLSSAGRSTIVDIGPVPESATWSNANAEGCDFWVVSKTPAPLQEGDNPPTGWTMVNRAPAGGVVGRVLRWPAGFQYPMHRTPTLDYIIVISGQLELGLEDGTQLLGPGDVLIQRGTEHRWRVPGLEPCLFVAVMIDAAPSVGRGAT